MMMMMMMILPKTYQACLKLTQNLPELPNIGPAGQQTYRALVIGPAGQQTYRAYVLNIPTAITTTATTTAILPNLKTKIVIT